MTATSTPRRRGRPRTVPSPEGIEPRQEILQHAAARFSAAGVAATRMGDIAASVGISTPALYHWFDNLDAIVEALLRYVVEESAAFATAVAAGPGSCAERLGTLVTQHVERLTAGPYDLWFVAGLSSAETRRFVTVGRSATQWRRAVGALVRQGCAGGEFVAVEADLAVAAISGLVYGALQLRHQTGSVNAAAVADLALRALGASPGSARGRS